MEVQRPLRALTDEEIRRLQQQGCSALNQQWSAIRVSDGFRSDRLWQVRLEGPIQLGALTGDAVGGPAELRNARIVNCQLGDNVRIVNVGGCIQNYQIRHGATVENVGTISARAQARFGNGVEVSVLNEAGGREVLLFDLLSCQIAAMMCLHRYRPRLVERLQQMARDAAARAHNGRGTIGASACVRAVPEMQDVHVGPSAVLDGCTRLIDGSILSHPQAPTRMGAGVQAQHFIVAEGAIVDGAALLENTYVGQACRVGRQFSAENCLLFANCEAFHGEACSVFAGPYTVTHHKSTLLIAGMFSFYNAGSGTNQSNHMYKLGPVHEGRLERGCKTGSFSYLMWPCQIGPFSVVLGKHNRNFDTSRLPFSHIQVAPDGRCLVVPGLNLTTVGTVRDGAEWPQRDRRHASLRRDQITFPVFSPYTVGRMMLGVDLLQQLQRDADRSVDTVVVGGAEIKRVLLRTGQKYYRRAIEMYLAERLVSRVESHCRDGRSWRDAVAVRQPSGADSEWIDLGGQLMPQARLQQLQTAIEEQRITDIDGCHAALQQIADSYAEDEWAWVFQAYKSYYDLDLLAASLETLQQTAERWLTQRCEFLELVLVDASKEFESPSRWGFGTHGQAQAADADFAAVRGEFETNSFVTGIRAEIAALPSRVETFKETLVLCHS